MVLFNRKEDCCGCTACKHICPVPVIDMVSDEEGFLYSQINNEMCIECGLCYDICPVKAYDKIDKNSNHEVYAVKNENVLLASSSGAVFTELADYINNEIGVIYGAIYDENLKLFHSQTHLTQE